MAGRPTPLPGWWCPKSQVGGSIALLIRTRHEHSALLPPTVLLKGFKRQLNLNEKQQWRFSIPTTSWNVWVFPHPLRSFSPTPLDNSSFYFLLLYTSSSSASHLSCKIKRLIWANGRGGCGVCAIIARRRQSSGAHMPTATRLLHTPLTLLTCLLRFTEESPSDWTFPPLSLPHPQILPPSHWFQTSSSWPDSPTTWLFSRTDNPPPPFFSSFFFPLARDRGRVHVWMDSCSGPSPW